MNKRLVDSSIGVLAFLGHVRAALTGRGMSDASRVFILVAAALFSSAAPTLGQDASTQAATQDAVLESDKKEREAESPAESTPWNRFETKWVTFQPTMAMAIDFVRYSQDATSVAQVGDLTDFEVPEVRAVRAGIFGTINFEKPWFFYVAGAYRGFGRGFDREKNAAWGLFDLSLTIPAGKLGRITVGKAKEPFSMERLMGGGVQPGIERAMGTDALTAARNAGFQIKNSFANDRMTWAAGVFNDWLFNEERFEQGSTQVIGRLTGLAMDRPDGPGLLHLGLGGRYSNVKPGVLRFDNSPEVFSSPLFVDTGEFSVYRTRVLGHQFDDLAYVRRTVLKTTHEDAPGSTRQGESIPGVPPQ